MRSRFAKTLREFLPRLQEGVNVSTFLDLLETRNAFRKQRNDLLKRNHVKAMQEAVFTAEERRQSSILQ